LQFLEQDQEEFMKASTNELITSARPVDLFQNRNVGKPMTVSTLVDRMSRFKCSEKDEHKKSNEDIPRAARKDWKRHLKDVVCSYIPNFFDNVLIAEKKGYTWVELRLKDRNNADDAIDDPGARKMEIEKVSESSVLMNKAAEKDNGMYLEFNETVDEPYVVVDVARNEALREWIERQQDDNKLFCLKVRNGKKELLSLGGTANATTGTPEWKITSAYNVVTVSGGGRGSCGSSEEDTSSLASNAARRSLFEDAKRKRDGEDDGTNEPRYPLRSNRGMKKK